MADLPVGWLVLGVDERTVARAVAAQFDALHPFAGAVDAEAVRRCHDAGLAVNVWTCDDPVRIAQLAGWGVEGIVTNVPDVALRAVGRG